MIKRDEIAAAKCDNCKMSKHNCVCGITIRELSTRLAEREAQLRHAVACMDRSCKGCNQLQAALAAPMKEPRNDRNAG